MIYFILYVSITINLLLSSILFMIYWLSKIKKSPVRIYKVRGDSIN